MRQFKGLIIMKYECGTVQRSWQTRILDSSRVTRNTARKTEQFNTCIVAMRLKHASVPWVDGDETRL